MAELYRVDSPITREQRNNINATFQDILTHLSNIRFQIAILAGGTELEVILQRIEDTITRANNTENQSQQVLADITTGLNDLQNALQSSITATQSANDAANDARNAIVETQNLVNQLGNGETYDNSKTYQLNNIVEYNGSSFIAIQTTTGNPPPTLPLKRNDYWQLLAQRGVDGIGSVSSVNGIGPQVTGEVTLEPSNIGAATEQEFVELRNEYQRSKDVINQHLVENSNGQVALNIPGYVGAPQSTHPSQVVFSTPWNGYTHWLAFTPYPYENENTENPSICASNDGINYVVPAGLVNPLDSTPNQANMHHSDPRLVFNESTNTLEIFYRTVERGENSRREYIQRRTTTDGRNFTPAEVVSPYEPTAILLSPAIIIDEGIYKIWTYNAIDLNLRYYESQTGDNWIFVRSIERPTHPDNLYIWHMDIRRTSVGYEMYYSASRDGSYNGEFICYAVSQDNISFGEATTVISRDTYGISGRRLYKPDFVDVNGVRTLLYGVTNNKNEWYITASYGSTDNPTVFRGIKQEDLDGGSKTIGAQNYYVSENGNNTFDGLTELTPKRTITSIIDGLNKQILNPITINVSPGTYNENLNIQRFYGSDYLYIRNSGTNPVNLLSADIRDCNAFINLTGLTFNTTSNTAVMITGGLYNVIDNCRMTGTTSTFYGVLLTRGARANITNCVISNKNQAIACEGLSNILSNNNSGENNFIGLKANSGARIAKSLTQPNGSTPEYSDTGGEIV